MYFKIIENKMFVVCIVLICICNLSINCEKKKKEKKRNVVDYISMDKSILIPWLIWLNFNY